MKDSVGFKLFNIPVNRGGGSYYYHIIDPGNVNSPMYKDTVKYNDSVFVHYQGRRIDWTMFDGTYKGSKPIWQNNEDSISFKVNAVIKGWSEALMQMKTGEKRRVVLPWQLGYGSTGSGAISPYSTLIFDIQLISFGTPKNK
jgi:FKBP-type peptidyl-prolyl cis-trans isomerase